MPDRFEVRVVPWGSYRGSPLELALDEGWEPFAVTEGSAHGQPTAIWLKRIVPDPGLTDPQPVS